MSYIGKNIKKLRTVKGLSQSKFAELFDIKRASIGAYEEGRAEPKTDVIIKISKHFGLTLDALLAKELSVNQLSKFDLDNTDSTNNISKFENLTNIISKPQMDLDAFHQKASFKPNSKEIELLSEITAALICEIEDSYASLAEGFKSTDLNQKALETIFDTCKKYKGLAIQKEINKFKELIP